MRQITKFVLQREEFDSKIGTILENISDIRP